MSLTFLFMYLFGLAFLLLCRSPNKRLGYNTDNRKKPVLRINLGSRSFILLLLIIAVGMLCATRDLDSYDTFVYVPWYKQIQGIPLLQRDGTYGIFFEIFSKVTAKILNCDYPVFFFLVAAFNIVVVYRAIMRDKMRKDTAILSFALYMVLIGFYYSFIVLRQGLAITMVIWAYCVLEESKKKALLLCAAGTLFHETALVAVVCILLFYKTRIRLKRVTIYFLLVTSLFLYVSHSTTRFIIPILQALLNVLNRIDAFTFHKYILYFESDALSYDISLLYILYHLITFVLVCYIYRDNGHKALNDRDRFFVTINVLGLLLIGFFAAASAITRLVEYMVSCTYTFLIPNVLNRMTCRRDTKIIIGVIMAVMTVLHLRIILGPIDLFI